MTQLKDKLRLPTVFEGYDFFYLLYSLSYSRKAK